MLLALLISLLILCAQGHSFKIVDISTGAGEWGHLPPSDEIKFLVAARSCGSTETEIPAPVPPSVESEFGSLIRRSSSNLSVLSGAQIGSEYVENVRQSVADAPRSGPSAAALRKHQKFLDFLSR
jgi:hypothetical protein